MVNVTFTGGRDGYRVHRRRAMSTQDKTGVTEVMLDEEVRRRRARAGVTKETAMRVMVLVKASKRSETSAIPTGKELAEMGKFNEELVKAGVMLAGEGLHPSSKAKRVVLSGGKKSIVDGPFTETKELVAGYWLWQVKSMDEAVEWARRCPNPMPGEEGVLELRPVFETEEFGAELTPELRAQDERLRAEIERQHKR
jgi:hypothetical protein